MALNLELLFRQLFALIMKNIMILYARGSAYSTVWTSTYFPILISIYLSVILKLYYPTATYGIGAPVPIRNVVDSMNVKPGMLVLLNNASSIGGPIDQVINAVAAAPRAAGKQVMVTSSQDDFLVTCRPNFAGTTACFAAAVFQSSPTEGPDGLWNYTIRGAASLGQTTVDVTMDNNDVQYFVLPLQHAIDTAIAALNSSTGASPLPPLVDDILFTSITEDAWKLKVQQFILQSNINFAAIVWILTIVGVAYRVVSAMAQDRESQMSDLIEAMMPNTQRWQPQMIRLVSTHIAFGFAYSPGWLAAGILFKLAYLKHSSMGIAIIGWLLAGGAMTGFALVAGACFRKAHMSSIIAVGVIILLGIVTQIKSKEMSTATVAVTGLLFTPMAFVNFIIFCCRWEYEGEAIKMGHGAPNSPWDVTGGGFWFFFLVQILLYPVIAALVERYLHGTMVSRSARVISMDETSTEPPVVVDDVSKIYESPLLWRLMLRAFGKKNEPVVAANHLSMTALQGQIMVLVGANGCGKTTILNAIAGLHSPSSGHIRVNGSGGIGICPQKNVLWDSLTVMQHAQIFNKLKATDSLAVGNDLNMLLKACGLEEKRKFQTKNLSGGQKRKLQLLMMLTGGSRVCCVDEASGGLDPLSRRKIWDILLAERTKRTVILCTHFLDEAEFLADNMVIMAKGEIKTMGSVSELKSTLGNGYRVQVLTPGTKEGEVEKFEELDTVPDSAQALAIIKDLESKGIKNYQIAGPTIEEVFMKLAADRDAEYEDTELQPMASSSKKERESAASLKSLRGEEVRHRVGALSQVKVLIRKRWTVFQRSPLPTLVALVTPIVAAGLLSILMRHYQNPSCDIGAQFSVSTTALLDPKLNPLLAVGPADALTPASLSLVAGIFPNNTLGTGNGSGVLLDSIHLVDSFADYNAYTQQKFANLTPGGLYLGDATTPPTISIRSDLFSPGTVFSGVFLQNVLDVLLTRVRIATNFTPYDFAWPAGTGDSLQFIFYFGLVMCAAPAFFGLYPCRERVRSVRAMEYSNGVRPLPLWAAYTLFDFVNILVSSSLVVVIFATKNDESWYNIGYFYVVLLLYGLAAILLTYVISKIAGSHFAAFACCAGGQGFMLLVYLTSYMTIAARVDPTRITRAQNIAYYVIGSISPITQLLRASMSGLNLFSLLCQGTPPAKASYGGEWSVYGAPIMFLILQSMLMFGFLVWSDHRYSLGPLKRKRANVVRDPESTATIEPEVAEEEARVVTSDDGLRVMHIDKVFRSFMKKPVHAVDNLTFGVKQGEVFALVGPNGAGKSTTISMLRGEIQPTGSQGQLYIQDVSVAEDRYLARFHLGVCPQFDAMDTLSVREHLAFYARIRGVINVTAAVEAMIRSVGLQPFADRMADKLSGGNKRKLSLAMALIGNPEVVLLDEPSSGMDPLAKRNMWRTLAKFRPGRSILLTTHSMEEADALASRVGVISRRLLDVGTTQHLRAKHGHGFHIHVVMASAPHTSPQEMADLQAWIEAHVPGARLEGLPYHGQLRYIVPATVGGEKVAAEADEISAVSNGAAEGNRALNGAANGAALGEGPRSVGSLFMLLEENKAAQGIAFYSVSPATFDEVFLKVIERHDVGEEEITAAPRWTLRQLFPRLFSVLPATPN